MKKTIIIIMVISAIIAGSFLFNNQDACATTEWKCMRDCQSRGYGYRYCKHICSY